MAINFNPLDVLSGFNLTKLNQNFQNIKTALTDGLSRSGNGSNQMEADIDLNNNDLLNGGVVNATDLFIDGERATPSNLVNTSNFATAAQGAKADAALIGVSSKQFGLLTTNTAAQNDAIIDAIEASTDTVVSVPEGRYLTNKTQFEAVNKRYYGPGQFVMNGFGQAPQRSFITTVQPVPSDDRYEFFDGGFEKAHSASYSFIGSGANPSTLPTVYTNFPQWNARVHIHDFTAGFNVDPADHALGRSGAFADTLRMYHGGQGDLVGRNFFGEISTTRVGATHFLATPALIVENGNLGVTSGVGCGYLNHSEYIFSDNGNAIAVIDRVRNYVRTNSGTTLDQVWGHDRAQSSGAEPCDFAYSPSGKWKVLYDSTAADLGANKAFAALKADDRIYWNASSTPDLLNAKWYADVLSNTYDTFTGGQKVTVVNGNPTLQVSQNDVTIDGDLFVSGSSAWTADTTTPTANGAFTSVTCNRRYKKLGRTVQIYITIVITTNGAAADFISVPLPFEAMNTDILAGAVTAGNFFPVVPRTSGNNLIILNATGGYPGGTGYTLNISGAYEATT